MNFKWDEVEETIMLSRRNLLHGPPGLGKTTILHKLAEKERESGKEVEVFSVNLHDESTVAELIGHFMPTGDRFTWMDGPVLAAWRKSHEIEAWLIVDEIDLASGGVLSIMRGVLNDADVARISIPNQQLAGMSDEEIVQMLLDGQSQEHLRPGPGFKVVATMNGEPTDLDAPLLDRFNVKWHITEPHPDAIAALPEDLQEIARRSCKETSDARRYSLRSWMAFADLREKGVSEEIAAKAVWAERGADCLAGLKAERKLKNSKETDDDTVIANEAISTAADMTVTGKPVRVYHIVTGKPGRKPKAKCDCGNTYQTRMTAVSPGDPLTCDTCSKVIAKAGKYSVIEKHGSTSEGHPNWVELDAYDK